MAILWIFFPDRQQKLELDDGPVTVGRTDGNTVRIDEPMVSKTHARIVKDDLGWKVEDLGSSNGTWLDGKCIDSARLVVGARLKIGSTEFLLDDTQIDRIFINLNRDRIRRLRRNEARLQAVREEALRKGPGSDEASDLQAGELADVVKDRIELLPERQREVLTLHLYHEMPYGEIASTLGCS